MLHGFIQVLSAFLVLLYGYPLIALLKNVIMKATAIVIEQER